MLAVLRTLTATDLVVALGVLLLLGLAPAAHLVADAEPRMPAPVVPYPDARPAADARGVRALPAGLPPGMTVETPEDLRELATAALGDTGAAELLDLLDHEVGTAGLVWSLPWDTYPAERPPYPYRYPLLERLLDAAPPGTLAEHDGALGAALVQLAAHEEVDEFGSGWPAYPEAGPAAVAVLQRAAEDEDCAARLDLLAVLAADSIPRDEPVRLEARRAAAACPGDPTPYWLLAQYLSSRAQQVGVFDLLGDPVPDDAVDTAIRVLEDGLRRNPGSPDLVAGIADVHLREASRTAPRQPFAARDRLRTAAGLYRRTLAATGSADHAAGLARALVRLGEPDAAADVLRPHAEESDAGYLLELLLTAEEEGGDFAAARATATRLDGLGAAAYPRDTGLFPTPAFGATFEEDDLVIPLVSVGLTRWAPLTVTLQPSEGGGGGLVEDLSFLPVFREDPGWTGTLARCPGWAWRRDAVLAGDPGAALVGFPDDLDFGDEAGRCWLTGWLDRRTRAVIAAEAGTEPELGRTALDAVHDRRQNLWRWAGDLDRAVAVIEEWRAAVGEEQPLPVVRLGEVRFLQGQYDESAAAFAEAARRTRQASWNEDLGVYQATLGRAAALLRSGRREEAVAELRWIEPLAAEGSAFQRAEQLGNDADFGAVAYHASALLADARREDEDLRPALEHYQAAAVMLDVLEQAASPTTPVIGLSPERLDANRAVAELAAGRVTEAGASVERALAVDPLNPAFLMTAGFVADRRGDRAAAIAHNRAAVASDPGAFPAANDLGVQLARTGRPEAALTALRQAVAAQPSYALGWFNLGAVHASMGPGHLLAAQGSLARAGALDPDLAGRRLEPTIDAQTYRTGLDLSRPLPPRWSLADLERAAPATSAGLLAVLLAAVGLSRASGRGAELAERWAGTASDTIERVPLAGRLRAPAWGLGLTIVILVVAAARQGWVGWWALAGQAFGFAVLAGVAVRARVVVARVLGEESQQHSWAPGLLLGVGVTALGSAWAPLPVLGPAPRRTALHAAAPSVLAVLAGLLLLQAAWLGVPLTHTWAVAALVMAASMLLPLPPLDGARLARGGLLAGLGLLGAALLVVLGVA